MKNENHSLGEELKERRIAVSLTLKKLADLSGISQSHLGRIEQGSRFPSARVLKKISKPLGFNDNEIFYLAGYISASHIETGSNVYQPQQLDPNVAAILAKETIEVQQAMLSILTALKTIANSQLGTKLSN